MNGDDGSAKQSGPLCYTLVFLDVREADQILLYHRHATLTHRADSSAFDARNETIANGAHQRKGWAPRGSPWKGG